jgi:hypothetical protein
MTPFSTGWLLCRTIGKAVMTSMENKNENENENENENDLSRTETRTKMIRRTRTE